MAVIIEDRLRGIVSSALHAKIQARAGIIKGAGIVCRRRCGKPAVVKAGRGESLFSGFRFWWLPIPCRRPSPEFRIGGRLSSGWHKAIGPSRAASRRSERRGRGTCSNGCFHSQAPLRSVGPVAQRDGQVARATQPSSEFGFHTRRCLTEPKFLVRCVSGLLLSHPMLRRKSWRR